VVRAHPTVPRLNPILLQPASRKPGALRRTPRPPYAPPACQSAAIHPQFANKPSGGIMLAVQSGNFQFGLMLAAALAVSVMPTGGAQAYTQDEQQACSGDAFRLCSAEIPDVDRVTVCMIRNKSQLSPGCRVFFREPERETAVTPVAAARPLSIRPASSRKPVSARPRKPKKHSKAVT
jgi:hypothetical protein